MNDYLDIEPILDDWLTDGVDVLPDRSVDAVLATVQRTSQRRAWRVSRRTSDMTGSSRLVVLIGAAVLVALLTGGLLLSTGRPTEHDGIVVTAPTPSPTAPSSVAPSSPPAAVLGVSVRGATAAAGVPGTTGTIVFGVDTGEGVALLAIRPDGTGLRELVPPGTCCAVLAPDGAKVIFESDQPDSSLRAEPRWNAGAPAIMAIDAPGGYNEAWPTDVAPGIELLPGAWTGPADFAFEGVPTKDAADTGQAGIYLSLGNGGGLALGDIVRITTPPAGRADIPLAFSPDGKQLLFLRTRDVSGAPGTPGDLFVVGVGTVSQRRGGSLDYSLTHPWQVNAFDTYVVTSELFGSGASWAPDGTRIAFTAFDEASDIASTARGYIVDVGTRQATPITGASKNMTSARWSPDGAWIAYDITNGDGSTRDVWAIRPDGSEGHRLVSHPGGSCCAQWSPDSQHLIAQGGEGPDAGLFIINADGSGSSPLVHVDDPYQLRDYQWGAAPLGAP
jgi:WD40 repeat protein